MFKNYIKKIKKKYLLKKYDKIKNTIYYEIKLDNLHEVKTLRKIINECYYYEQYYYVKCPKNSKLINEFLFHLDIEHKIYYSIILSESDFKKLNTAQFYEIIINPIYYIKKSELTFIILININEIDKVLSFIKKNKIKFKF